jgi:carnitine-CoA ligase
MHSHHSCSTPITGMLDSALGYWAQQEPNKRFAQCDGPWMSYAQAERRSTEIAAGLQGLGVKRGDRVALISATRIEVVVALIALARMGAISVPLNTYLKGDFLRFQLKDCAAETVIVDREGLNNLALVLDDLPELRTIVSFDEPADPVCQSVQKRVLPVHVFSAISRPENDFVRCALESTDAATILYTSGTTGMPKGCVCGHGYLMSYSLGPTEDGLMGHDDILFTTFPLFHSAGFFLTLAGAIRNGASLILERSFSASGFTRRATETSATVAFGAGAMGMAILASKASEYDRAHSLRLCSFPPMSPASQEAFEARFRCDVFSCVYGQTEAAPITHMSASQAKRYRGSLGRPSPRLDVQLFDENDRPIAQGSVGEIVCRPREPEVIFQGYWRCPEATVAAQRNLWHHTGDLARFDADGMLYFVDRKKDAMRRRGENVSSFELERAILQNPKIAAVATHAVPSELGEDEIKACIVLIDSANMELAELFEFFKRNLPYYAVPRYVEFFDALPINANGRVMKPLLRERGIGKAADFEAFGFTIGRDERRA